MALTIIRTVRDDFGVEIWRGMGVTKTPSIFATTETIVAICVTALNALAICIIGNLKAIRVTVVLMCAAFALVAASVLLQSTKFFGPFGFMVACGIGLYVPYVAFHTTVFERLIAASRYPANLGFLMYLADALGYLGYATVMIFRAADQSPGAILPFFRTAMMIVAALSIVGLLTAMMYFQKVLGAEASNLPEEEPARRIDELKPAESKIIT